MLNAINWNQWQFRMKARFRKRGVRSLVDGSRHRPSDTPSDADLETRNAQYKPQEKWDNDKAFAAGDLVLSVDDTQQVSSMALTTTQSQCGEHSRRSTPRRSQACVSTL